MWFIGILVSICVLIPIFLFSQSRRLQIKHHTFETGFDAKIVVLSDLHLGVYKKANWTMRLVSAIQRVPSVDAVFLLGDFVYEAKQSEIEELLKPLKYLQTPVFAVLGNHDYDMPKNSKQKHGNLAIIKNTLRKYGVSLLDNTDTITFFGKTKLTITALGDERHNPFINTKQPTTQHSICIMHNPDSVDKLDKNLKFDLLLAGHTHNGQINIPFLYKLWLPTISEYVGGWYKTKNGPLLVSNGVGETALPFRLFSLPTIEVITLTK